MGAPSISLATAGQALAYADLGHSERQIAEMCGIGNGTAHLILQREGRWAYELDKPIVEQYRVREKELFRAAQRLRAAKCLEQFDKTIDKASAYQCVGMYSWLRQQDRLDAGEPTSIVETVNIHAVGALDKLAALLGQSLVGEAVDVTPGGNFGGNKG